MMLFSPPLTLNQRSGRRLARFYLRCNRAEATYWARGTDKISLHGLDRTRPIILSKKVSKNSITNKLQHMIQKHITVLNFTKLRTIHSLITHNTPMPQPIYLDSASTMARQA